MKGIVALSTPAVTGAAPRRRRPAARVVDPAAGASPIVPPDRTGLLVRTILTGLEDGKADDLVTIDLTGKTSLADAMVIATGRSTTQAAALADRVVKAIREAGFPAPRVEGLPHADWVLIDAGDVIAHIFRPEVRAFYNLEKMWGGDRPSEPRAEGRAPGKAASGPGAAGH